MAIRFQSEFKSDQGDQYKIEIHDSEWLGGTYTFNVDSRGFELEYTGETDDIVSPIIGSKLCVGAYSNDGYFETFIDSLKGYQEDRYRIVVYRSETHERRAVDDGLVFEPLLDEETETTYYLWWCGWIMQDLITIEDASQPYIYELTAVDGLGRLANIDYTDANVISQNGFGLTRITEIIKNALVDTGLDDLFGASDVFFETCANWWETTAHTYSTSTDVLYLTAADVGLFDSRDDDGNLIRTTSFDVLRQLATLFNARVYMERGRFVFEQIGTRTALVRYVTTYTKTATKISTKSTSDDIVLDQTLYGARLAGNVWNFLPALKRVSVTYSQRFLSPWFGAYRFENGDTEFSPGFIAGGQGIQLALYGPINYAISCSNRLEFGNDTTQLIVIFRVEIRVEDSSNPGTYWYFNRAFNGYSGAVSFGTAGWSTTAGYYYFDMPMTSVYESIGSTSLLHTITTSDIPVTGSLRVRFDLYNKYDFANGGAAYVLDAGIDQSETWNAVIAFSRVDDGSEPANGVVYTSTNGSADVASNLTLELGDVVIADGALQTGDLAAYNGSSWVATGSWRVGNSGTGLPILKLLTSETLALHHKPVQRYDGSIVVSSNFGRRIVFGSNYYLRMNGRYTANTDEWSGTYFLVQRNRSNISELTPTPLDRTPGLNNGGTTGVNNTPNELTGGKVAGMTMDAVNKKMGPFQEVATGGKVNGTFQSTGAATMSSSLTIAGDTDFEGSHTALIEDVTHNDGSEYDVKNTDFIVFNKWDGANGQSFINLPAVSSSEGRMIRFKSDDTITANTYVTLRPDAGDTGVTIDGETSVDFNRSYDGIMVLCHNNQWYIVQRKSK